MNHTIVYRPFRIKLNSKLLSAEEAIKMVEIVAYDESGELCVVPTDKAHEQNFEFIWSDPTEMQEEDS